MLHLVCINILILTDESLVNHNYVYLLRIIACNFFICWWLPNLYLYLYLTWGPLLPTFFSLVQLNLVDMWAVHRHVGPYSWQLPHGTRLIEPFSIGASPSRSPSLVLGSELLGAAASQAAAVSKLRCLLPPQIRCSPMMADRHGCSGPTSDVGEMVRQARQAASAARKGRGRRRAGRGETRRRAKRQHSWTAWQAINPFLIKHFKENWRKETIICCRLSFC